MKNIWIKGWVLLLVLTISACQSQPKAEPTPNPDPQIASVTPGLRPIWGGLQTCAASLKNNPPPFFVERFYFQVDYSDSDYVFRLGEPDPPSPFAALIAYDEIVVVLHPDNPVSGLSFRQLQSIFSGRIRNWDEFSGGAGEIQVWALLAGDEIRQIFEARVMDGIEMSPNTKLAPNAMAVANLVAADENAVGYLPRSWVNSSVASHDLGIRVPLLAVGEQEPEGASREILVCLQAAGGQAALSSVYISLSSED